MRCLAEFKNDAALLDKMFADNLSTVTPEFSRQQLMMYFNYWFIEDLRDNNFVMVTENDRDILPKALRNNTEMLAYAMQYRGRPRNFPMLFAGLKVWRSDMEVLIQAWCNASFR